ncbi:MAG: class I SAM-dependent methyltransferase [bacterium]
MLKNSLNQYGRQISTFLDEFGLEEVKKKMVAGEDISPEVRQVKESFELQWKKWGMEERIFGKDKDENLNDVRENMFHPDMSLDYLKDMQVCEAGCGHGMLVEALAEHSGEIVGFDVGEGVQVAYARGNGHPNTHYLQADVSMPPFRGDTFDFLFARGVIHHTPNTRLAFSKLAALVKPGGYYSIWVYPIRNVFFEVVTKLLRKVTTRMHRKLLYGLCYIPVPLLFVFPAYSGTSLKKSSWRQCAQVVFDFFAPKYQTHHTEEEVVGWFVDEGFFDMQARSDPISMTGRKIEKENSG